MKWMVRLLASGFYSGYFPRGSGTVASLAACGLWVLLSGSWVYPAVTVVFVAIGFPVCGWAQKHIFPVPDSPRIVIDEIAGMLVTMAGFSFSGRTDLFFLAGGFVLFRALDIAKPPPISHLQNIKGGAGIMLDDLAAGAVANGLLHLARYLW
jgi:phosphatidylglycerophosphatase A